MAENSYFVFCAIRDRQEGENFATIVQQYSLIVEHLSISTYIKENAESDISVDNWYTNFNNAVMIKLVKAGLADHSKHLLQIYSISKLD